MGRSCGRWRWKGTRFPCLAVARRGVRAHVWSCDRARTRMGGMGGSREGTPDSTTMEPGRRSRLDRTVLMSAMYKICCAISTQCTRFGSVRSAPRLRAVRQ